MKNEQIDDLLKRLPPGAAVLSHPRWPRPIPVVNSLIDMPKVTDDELQTYMKPFWDHFKPELALPVEKPAEDSMSTELRQLMMEIANHPGRSSTEYYKSLQWPASKGNRAKGQSESLQLIKCHPIKLVRRGGSVEAIELLPLAYEKLGLTPAKHQGKGGFVHRWWVARLMQHLASMKPVIEFELNGKAVDLGVETADGWLAFEVQLDCKEALVQDLLTKDIYAGFFGVFLLVQTKDEVEQVKKIITDMGFEGGADVKLLTGIYNKEEE